jgi:hypothetical protein
MDFTKERESQANAYRQGAPLSCWKWAASKENGREIPTSGREQEGMPTKIRDNLAWT